MRHERQGMVITKSTAATQWRGERMDYGFAMDILMGHANRAKDVCAETSVNATSD